MINFGKWLLFLIVMLPSAVVMAEGSMMQSGASVAKSTTSQFEAWMKQNFRSGSKQATTAQAVGQESSTPLTRSLGAQSTQTLPQNQFSLPMQNESNAGQQQPLAQAQMAMSHSSVEKQDDHKALLIVDDEQGEDKTAKPLSPFERDQQILLRSIPRQSRAELPEAKEAFNSMLQQNMPLSPEQVIKLHQQIDISQRAAAVPAVIPPKPVSTTLMVNLAPGATPPAIRLAQGYVSSLVFVDSTGAPWPIAAFDVGNPKALNIQWDGKSNILLLQSITPYSYGDIVIRLVGLQTPITLELVSGQRVVDYRIDLHVSGLGPNAKEVSVGSGLPQSASQLLLSILDGVAPAGSKQLQVSDAQSQAWLLGEKIYFRTRMTVLSPGWVGKMVSPDGMHAYELPKTSSVLVSRYGEPVELRIEGF